VIPASTRSPGAPLEPPLPALRQDLQLLEGPGDATHHSWLIHDPAQHRYLQISATVFEILALWQPIPASALASEAKHRLGRDVATTDLETIASFLCGHGLTVAANIQDARVLAAKERRAQQTLARRWVHNYLFFRVPLARPDGFLARTLPWVEPLFSRGVRIASLVAALLGVYLTSRQWDEFAATFLQMLSFEGMAAYGAALAVIKTLHELGHAYAATRAGVRVNTMGIAFMVTMPVLYTDVTDAWRLTRRRDKVIIDAAGIAVELALAAFALLAWSFLADGALRSIAFVTATTSLAMGLAINLNPLMRFDGYHLLADSWGIANLQPRSAELAQWWLRETLFALGRPPPELWPRTTHSLLIAYAVAVFVYRVALFLGIALLVYHMTFKVLGIVLFVIEIVWFILLPIWRELKDWWAMRAKIAMTRRSRISASILVVAIGAALIPWYSNVAVQAVVTAEHETQLFAPRPARIDTLDLSDGKLVTAGQVLLMLRSPDLDHELVQTTRRIALIDLRLARIAADGVDRANRVVLEGERARDVATKAGLDAERTRLSVRAPGGGRVRDLDPELRPGMWVDETTPFARIVDISGRYARGYVRDDESWRIALGADAVFVPEDPTLPRGYGRVVEIADTGTRAVDVPYLASVNGGAIPADRAGTGDLTPRSGWRAMRVRMHGPAPARVMRGTLHITALRESFAAAAWRRLLRVLVRESGA
jgi:putative peptide zinc metalloprotease protein